jgi:hypothetical protein
MRLEKELGALNSEVLAIREKWKIALNIEKKKIAIERLISLRRLRDGEQIHQMIQVAVQNEQQEIENKVISDLEKLESKQHEFDISDETQIKTASQIIELSADKIEFKNEEDFEITEKNESTNVEINEIDKFPAHLTVAWLKQRMLSKKSHKS